MQSYPGATFGVDARQAQPKPYYEYWVSLLPQASISHVVHLPSKGLEFLVPPPSDTKAFVRDQDTYETSNPVDVGSFGPTTRAPLGYIVHARSGDKGSDCNVGFFVRQADEWDWLRSVLTVDKVRELLGDDDTGKPSSASNCPIFAMLAVHFLLKDHLDRVASSSTYDVLGKNLAEYLRAKHVEISDRFLERGKI
ncbi:hypothetical protein HYQ46_012246 [Verticillium longisporum]|nr:hypothetical protein HYQ46_012246 [Verticillium longisporum]